MSEWPPPAEPDPNRPASELHRTGVRARAVLRGLGLHWCLTCCVAAVMFLGGVAWLLATDTLPWLGVPVPRWVGQVAGGVTIGAIVVLVLLSLVPHKEL